MPSSMAAVGPSRRCWQVCVCAVLGALRASSVLPVPGEPTSRMPFGMRAPSRPKDVGSRRKASTSCRSPSPDSSKTNQSAANDKQPVCAAAINMLGLRRSVDAQCKTATDRERCRA
jgi:hypothetical protein